MDNMTGECTSIEVKCCNCGGNHIAGFQGCVYAIKAQQVGSIKSNMNFSYAEAVKRVNEYHESEWWPHILHLWVECPCKCLYY